MGVGAKGKDPISGGRLRFLPGFSGVSMVKPFPDCVRDLWSLVDGSNMLNLNFEAVTNSLKVMKKSVKRWVQDSTTKEDHQNAMVCMAAVDEVSEALSANYARTYSKRQIVEILVSYYY